MSQLRQKRDKRFRPIDVLNRMAANDEIPPLQIFVGKNIANQIVYQWKLNVSVILQVRNDLDRINFHSGSEEYSLVERGQ